MKSPCLRTSSTTLPTNAGAPSEGVDLVVSKLFHNKTGSTPAGIREVDRGHHRGCAAAEVMKRDHREAGHVHLSLFGWVLVFQGNMLLGE